MIGLILAISLKSLEFNHKHQRSILLINSLEPKNGRINPSAVGADLINSFLSSVDSIRCPPSLGILPNIMFGTSQSGVLLPSINKLGASKRYALILIALLN